MDAPDTASEHDQDRRVLSVSEAAARLGVSGTTVRNWMQNGSLTGFSVRAQSKQRFFVYEDAVLKLLNDDSEQARDDDLRQELESLRTRCRTFEDAYAALQIKVVHLKEALRAHSAVQEALLASDDAGDVERRQFTIPGTVPDD